MIDLHELAIKTLRENDAGGYTVPTHGLYPFQWNWDSAIVALGWLPFDEVRAWQEVTTLLEGQWDNGMIPHVVFHQDSDKYFPGPDIWGGYHQPKTTSISQPPVLGSVVKILHEKCKDRDLVARVEKTVVEALLDYHVWWYRDRDPENTGLVVSYHPWESGMDNSPAWDGPMAAVPAVTWEYQRRDTGHIDPSERPHKSQYDRFLYLIDFFKAKNFGAQEIYQGCPYQVQDVSIVSILHRATKDLLALCDILEMSDDRTVFLGNRLTVTENAICALWSEKTQFFHSRNRLTGELLLERTNAGFLPLFANLASPSQVVKLGPYAKQWLDSSEYGMASTHPDEAGYEPQRYWRGPVWLHINWMIWEGLKDAGFEAVAEELQEVSRRLIDKAHYSESYHCELGVRSGGAQFSWSAAMALYWLLPEARPQNKVICFGEALVDLLAESDDNTGNATNKLAMFAGGAPANVSCAVAKLGGNSYFVGMLSDDAFGRFLLQSLRQYGVATDYVCTTSDYKTALACVFLDNQKERSFSFYREDTADMHFSAAHFESQWFSGFGIFHCCSNSLTTAQGVTATLTGIEMASKAKWLTSCDVNLRLSLWDDPKDALNHIANVLSLCDVIKMSQEELDFIKQDQSETDYVDQLLQQQAKLVVVTDGPAPLRWYTPSAKGEITPIKVDMLDATGAGDGFVGALLVGLSKHTNIPWNNKHQCAALMESLLWQASCAGALTTTKSGASDAIPCQSELTLFLREVEDGQP